MSGIIGHMTYAILASEAAAQRGLPVASLTREHHASYLAGAYLGCDIQTLPASTCADTGAEVGYGAGHLERSPITGGATTPWALRFDGKPYSPQTIHDMFYGRSHLALGWHANDRGNTLAWEALPDYFAAVLTDVVELPGDSGQQVAYVLGWITHVIGDCLIKGVRPGLDLHLLDGRYTPRNRPIQDLVSFHEVGRKELGLNWRRLMDALVATSVEPIQLHYMRVAEPRGRLAGLHASLWAPEHAPLLRATLSENRRYQRVRNERIVRQLALIGEGVDRQCDAELSQTADGLQYADMVALAAEANFRRALQAIADEIADMFERLLPCFAGLPLGEAGDAPGWRDL
jgi:hypothetical protein